MELHNVYIKQYKNLHDCDLDFSGCNRLAVLAGVNGSGKSNFLEAIAIVYHYFARLTYSVPRVNGCRMVFSVSGTDYDVCSEHDLFMVNGEERSFALESRGKLIIVYSGEFNRLLKMGFAEDLDKTLSTRNVVLLSAQSFQMLLLTKVLLEQRQSYKGETGLLFLPKAAKVRFTLNAESVNFGEPPEDEIEFFIREVFVRNGSVRKCRVEIEVAEFNQIMQEANHNWASIDATTIYFVLNRLMESEYGPAYISEVQIVFEYSSGSFYTSDDLSEGEKWLAMYDIIYSCLVDQDTLVLLDEPDAYLHEMKKRDFVRFVENKSACGVFTIMTTHSPNIINAVSEKSLFGFVKDLNNKVSITVAKDRILQKSLMDDRMVYFSNRPIILCEGVSDVRLIEGAINYFVENEKGYEDLRNRIKFDFVSIGGAANMVGAYSDFRRAFPYRKIYVALDSDDEGRRVLKNLVDNYAVVDVVNMRVASSTTKGFVFLIPRPGHIDGNTYSIEDYLPRSYIQSQMKRLMDDATCFHKLVNCKDAIKSEIRNNYKSFRGEEWRGFKPLIDFIANLSC